jgi:hypothetical protein
MTGIEILGAVLIVLILAWAYVVVSREYRL